MSIVVRAATRDDAPAIVRLIRALAEFEQLPGPSDDAAARLVEHGFGGTRHFESLIATVDDEIVGYAIFFMTYSTFLARPTLFLEDVFVHPTARRRGVATAVMEHLRMLAVERGCGRLEWMVLDWNAGAQALYRKLGAKQLDEWRLCRVEL